MPESAETFDGMNTPKHERAVVLGAGMAGLVTSLALSQHFEDVVIIEKTDIPDTPAVRQGFPQGQQLHTLSTAGQKIFDRYMPGFLDELVGVGAGVARVAEQTHVHALGMYMPEEDLGLLFVSAERPVFEHVARQFVGREESVAVRGLTQATGLMRSADGAIGGVYIESAAGPELLEASLVVDAMGAHSPSVNWIRAMGLPEVVTEQSLLQRWFVGTKFHRPKGFEHAVRQDEFWMSLPTHPQTRGGVISPVTQSQWFVSVSGRNTDPVPRSVDEVRAYAEELSDGGVVAGLVAQAEPVSQPKVFRKRNVTTKRFKKSLAELPGFLPIGDTVIDLDPIYGQGMSTAARQISVLDALLRQHAGDMSAVGPGYVDRSLEIARESKTISEKLASGDLASISQADTLDVLYKEVVRALHMADAPELA